jgi:hypothetical protein
VIHDDLFREFDETAAEYGWTSLGQPEQYLRRYGKRQGDYEVTVRVYANRPGTSIARVSRNRLGRESRLLSDDLGAQHPGKRDAALDWLRAKA